MFDSPAFTQTTFYCTDQHLQKPPFTPTSFTQPLLWARPKARWQNAAGCWIQQQYSKKKRHLQPLNSVPEGHKMSHLVIGQTKQGFGRSWDKSILGILNSLDRSCLGVNITPKPSQIDFHVQQLQTWRTQCKDQGISVLIMFYLF